MASGLIVEFEVDKDLVGLVIGKVLLYFTFTDHHFLQHSLPKLLSSRFGNCDVNVIGLIGWGSS